MLPDGNRIPFNASMVEHFYIGQTMEPMKHKGLGGWVVKQIYDNGITRFVLLSDNPKGTTPMDTVTLKQSTGGKTVQADVLERSDKRLKVVVKGTDIRIVLTREDVRKPYVGQMAGMEIVTQGK